MEIMLEMVGEGHSMDMLVALRCEVLRAANGLPPNTCMPEIERETRQYYTASLGCGRHIEYHAWCDGQLAGCGALCLYMVMPTCDEPTGQRAAIMNMYTRPAFRRKGVATAVLGRLLADARHLGLRAVHLEATAAGVPLYSRAGFKGAAGEMRLVL